MDKKLDVNEWLRRAKGSLELSKTPKSESILYEDLCFNCQQSAEKAMKALIIHLGLIPHKTHSFRKLIEELEKRIIVPEYILSVLELDDYAVNTRYPDDYFEVTEDEYKEAVKIAESVYNWVQNNIK